MITAEDLNLHRETGKYNTTTHLQMITAEDLNIHGEKGKYNTTTHLPMYKSSMSGIGQNFVGLCNTWATDGTFQYIT